MTTIAMMQMRVQPNELNRNLWHMRELLSLVGDTDVALFPECCDLGWAADSAPEQAEPIPEGSTYQRIRDMAVDFDIGMPFYFTDFRSVLYVPQPKGRRVPLVRSEAEEAPSPAAHLSPESGGGGTDF